MQKYFLIQNKKNYFKSMLFILKKIKKILIFEYKMFGDWAHPQLNLLK